jgi:hypothetical protein
MQAKSETEGKGGKLRRFKKQHSSLNISSIGSPLIPDTTSRFSQSSLSPPGCWVAPPFSFAIGCAFAAG